MSKITNVRLPTVSGKEYNAEQFNQLVRSLEQVVLHLNTAYTSYVSETKATQREWFGL
jgi:exonuclease VII small subunit